MDTISSLNSSQSDFIFTREFDAPRDLVWAAHTEAERLSRWWGFGNGHLFEIIKLDVCPDGIFHYAWPAGDGRFYGKFVFKSIQAPERLVYTLSFSDENEGVTRHPGVENETWPLEIENTVTFAEADGKTIMSLRGRPVNASPEEIETFVNGHDGMREGFGATYDQLQQFLKLPEEEQSR